jgi:hypothetical protein
LETIGYFLRERGFLEDVINKMSRPQREATLASYDSKWSVFRDWCGEHKFSPVSLTLPQFLDFLNFLFSEKKFSVQAVKGYRSVISSTLHLLGSWGSDWDVGISSLTQSMALAHPRTRHSSRKWDLSVEPMDKVSLKFLTFKTVFQVALATAQRWSELHALAFAKTAYLEDGRVILGFLPDFLAKTQAANTSSRPVTILSLSRSVIHDLPDRTLCPVHALKFYVDRTKDPIFSLREEAPLCLYR